jgi:error-prone DNA polymerase
LRARDLQRATHGHDVVIGGMVICRQRPQTASGVVFLSLEDETGIANVVLFSRIFEANRRVATTSSLLLVHGKIERSSAKRAVIASSIAPIAPIAPPEIDAPDVVYVVAARLEPLQLEGANVLSMSRDFH